MTRQSYLIFDEMPRLVGRKTRRWLVRARDRSALGTIAWRTQWRCYVYLPHDDTSYDTGCLADLAAFLGEQTLAQKEAAANEREKWRMPPISAEDEERMDEDESYALTHQDILDALHD